MRYVNLVIAALVAAGCGGDVNGLSSKRPDDRDAGGKCEPGTERCSCYGNKTCNDGLVCGSGLCVRLRGTGSKIGADAGKPPQTSTGYGGASTVSPVLRDAGAMDVDAGSGGTSGAGRGGASGTGGKGKDSGGTNATGDAGGVDTGHLPPVALFVMLDRSSSMVTTTTGQTTDNWTSAVSAVIAFVQDPLSENIDIGLGTFPVGMNDTYDCADGADCGTPVVPIGPVKSNAQAMINAMSAQRPQALALTPTECALRGMINQCLVFMSRSVTGEQCVAVLVTDGTPTQCDTNHADLLAIIADGEAKGVDSFTLGLPGADLAVLNDYAAAGGTSKAIDVSAGPSAFSAALEAIRGRVTHTTPP